MKPEGVTFARLAPAEQQELITVMTAHVPHALPRPEDIAALRLRVDYAPAGWYVWRPLFLLGEHNKRYKAPLVSARTGEDALAQARGHDPNATAQQIERSDGVLAVIELLPGGGAIPVAGRLPETTVAGPPDKKP